MRQTCQSVPAFLQLAAHPLRWRLITELAGGDYRVRELVPQIGQPQNLISYHLRLLRDGGLIHSARSSHDGRDSYYRLDLARCTEMLTATGSALHPALQLHTTDPAPRWAPDASVLFVCTGNSARSAIAQALLHHRSGGRMRVSSAGTRPKSQMHPNTIHVLRREYGIDIAGARPSPLDGVDLTAYRYVITVCDKAREACPELPHHPQHRHWSIPDPAADDTGESYPIFVRTAHEIATRVRYLAATLAAGQ